MEVGLLGEVGANVVCLVTEELKHVLAHAPAHQWPMVAKLVRV